MNSDVIMMIRIDEDALDEDDEDDTKDEALVKTVVADKMLMIFHKNVMGE